MTTPAYGETSVAAAARVVGVEPGSPGDVAGITPGDVVLAVDGRPVTDVLDWLWRTVDAAPQVTVARGDATLAVTVDCRDGSPPGVSFEAALFDGVRECVNACTFCFVTQMPRGLRPTLYIRDDDFRLSFLHGNFITLTNLTASDIERIISQRLSPLYVSLHAVDPAVRRTLLRPRVPDGALACFDALQAAGIELHVQIVAVPGVNDGEVLRETLSWLAARRSVASVGIVPAGHTHLAGDRIPSFTAEGARAVIELVEEVARFRVATTGSHWVHAADELYLRAGLEVPVADRYDDLPQFENGIGMVRSFLDGVGGLRGLGRPREHTCLVTGELFAPVLTRLVRDHDLERSVEVLAVRNVFFGGGVTVAGLLVGRDIIEAIRSHGAAKRYLVPDVVLNSDGLTLDDIPAHELGERAGARVEIVGSDGVSLHAALAGSSRRRAWRSRS